MEQSLDQKPQDELLEVSEVSKILGFTKAQVYRLIESGGLPGYRVGRGRGLRVFKSELFDWVRTRRI